MSAITLRVVHSDELGMRYPDHPMDARRHRLTVALCEGLGLFDRPDVELAPSPGPLSDERLARVFAPAFIAAVRRFSDQPLLAAAPEARQWGIGGDNTAYPGMHDDAARTCAACAVAADAVGAGEVLRALVPSGGSHHGLANRAWGFGIYNETAVAVTALLDAGLKRVAYIDLDVHHGNGTQWIFYEDPRVMTISVHESGHHLFPGSGFPAESGGAGAPGTSVNVALPPDAGDDAYRRAMAEVVVPAARAFAPEAIVAQCGVDHHHADPLSHLRTTMAVYPELWRALVDLADERCDGRIVALGGGGYSPCIAPPRAWTLLAETLAGVTLDRAIPEEWRELAVAIGCPEQPRELLADAVEPLAPPAAARAATEVDAAIAASRAMLARFWGSVG